MNLNIIYIQKCIIAPIVSVLICKGMLLGYVMSAILEENIVLPVCSIRCLSNMYPVIVGCISIRAIY